ncbi:MAG: hypothetical protein IKQ25_11045 [Lachnospiraceae bacterium]|nr:hypothetical protein [Lachnospiraceae bacterium]
MTKKTICFIVIFICLFIGIIAFGWHKTKDPLEPYNEILNEMNQEWNTNYQLVPQQGVSRDDFEEYITSMSLDEFKEYLNLAHEIDISHPVSNEEKILGDASTIYSK